MTNVLALVMLNVGDGGSTSFSSPQSTADGVSALVDCYKADKIFAASSSFGKGFPRLAAGVLSQMTEDLLT